MRNHSEMVAQAVKAFRAGKMNCRTLVYINERPYLASYDGGQIQINGLWYREATEDELRDLFIEFILSRPFHAIPFAHAAKWDDVLKKAVAFYHDIYQQPAGPDQPAGNVMDEIHAIAEGGWRGIADFLGMRALARDVLFFCVEAALHRLNIKLPWTDPVQIGEVVILRGSIDLHDTYRVRAPVNGETLEAEVRQDTTLPGHPFLKGLVYEGGFGEVIEELGISLDVSEAVPALMRL